MFSDNAEPMYMFRASPIAPFELPSIFRWFGTREGGFLLRQTLGEPVSCGAGDSRRENQLQDNAKPGTERDLHVGTGRCGHPLTLAAIFNSFFSLKSSDLYAANDNPGKRTIGFDFQYRLPHLRNWLTLYASGLLPEDDPTLLLT